ncbi:YraN family protein [Kitasatospora nipponensis]|uniref:YraN family protein n=1 Tax=Kitasatospora nipponensis TaxID=258049 RepID=UPI0031D01ED0
MAAPRAGPAPNAHTALGRYGEEVAARRLGQDGLRVLERNWRCREGELDIIALDGDTVAVCEVKTRSEHGFQQPAEAVGQVKADRLRRLAERWLTERWPVHFARLAQGAGPPPGAAVPLPPGGVRIDLVSVVSRARGAALVEHLRGVL